jgi:uncharacterized integral membrane protein (TIGR00697 family)
MQKQVPENPVLKNREIEGRTAGRAADFNPLVVVTALMVCCYLAANIMAVKIMDIFGTALFDAGTLIFPFSYMLGDVLAEIWGFKTARKVILLAFLCNVILVGATALAVVIPSPDYLAETARAYNTVFSYMPRIVVASLCAFLTGELSNAWLMGKIRALTGSGRLWVRTIGSSAVGHLLDTVIFCVIAFAGTVTARDLLVMIGSLYVAKLLIEAAAGTPIAYGVIGYLRNKYFSSAP